MRYWLHNIYKLLGKLQELINQGAHREVACFHGLSELSFISRTLYKKTGEFKKLAQNTFERLIDQTQEFCRNCMDRTDNIETHHYDFIAGLSGVGLYLNSFYKAETSDIMERITDYLAFVCDIGADRIPNWYVKAENQSEYNREHFPGGHIDFGFAHGIAAPMLYLTYTVNKDDKTKLKILDNLINIFLENQVKTSFGMDTYPALVTLPKYKSKLYEDKDVMPVLSWCYGNLTMLWPLIQAADKVNNQAALSIFERNLRYIYNDKAFFHFYHPVLCHGYASVLIINNLLANKLNSFSFLDLNDYLVDKLFGFYNSEKEFLFNELQNDDLLTGAPGILISLLGILTGDTELEKYLVPR